MFIKKYCDVFNKVKRTAKTIYYRDMLYARKHNIKAKLSETSMMRLLANAS